ncbi:hypothetical protein KsCSTR_21990 [Candidatus Kuenenia stuttgartiensis]|jgi:hypothetical protein|uniref:Uncharacterized protein n=1 Tax=Kuenenia stuttgartiensis TaxID=174633 RepID=Q1Q388_KUEST|nr:hypothetical protein KsCSTR_21990 [Candidatus Kuenenia stuttgartiensis]CAJ74479.1 unknown protein [Candidatus Kuenenia stuttgartiensis]
MSKYKGFAWLPLTLQLIKCMVYSEAFYFPFDKFDLLKVESRKSFVHQTALLFIITMFDYR